MKQSIQLIISLCALLLLGTRHAAESASQCSSRSGSEFCFVSGPLSHSCSPGAASLILKFQDPAASWSAAPGQGLNKCGSVSNLRLTGWSGPELQSGHVSQLPSLQSMEILDGNLTSLGPNICSNELQKLSLSRNRVRDLNQQALSRCDRLESLDLSDNRIESLPDGLLAACDSLRILKLSRNRLSQLGPRALQGADRLFKLHAQRNQFRTLGSLERAFATSRQLSLIDLRSNELFAYLPASSDGFCGPDNVTVLLHFAGCAPSSGTDGRSVCEAIQGRRCLGRSVHLVVTFTSCQVPLETTCAAAAAAATVAPAFANPPQTATSSSAVSTVKANTDEPKTSPVCPSVATAIPDCSLFTRLSDAATAATSDPAVWLLIALACTVLFALLQLLVSLAVCHRLKLRLARMQVRHEQLARETASHQSFCQTHRPYCSMMCSSRQSGLSGGRMTPSGRGPSSQFGGFSDFGEPTTLTGMSQSQSMTMQHQQQPLLLEQQQKQPIQEVADVNALEGAPDGEE